MAPPTWEIPRGEWQAYFDDLSRRLETTVASIEVMGAEIGAQVEAERGILRGVTYDDGDDIVVIALDTEGDAPEELERTISEPQKIYVDDENAATVLDIEDSEGNKTLVRMAPAPQLPPA
jgi:3-dehydroquinate synthase class II